jgi:methionyl-tRNA formyltransferase
MIRFSFFGSSEISIVVLGELSRRGLSPAVIVTTPDKARGRGMELAPNIVKAWGLANSIPVLDPAKLDDAFLEQLKKYDCEVAVVASYGKIIPEKVLDAAPKKTLNVHPSLLPLYRGPSPIQTAMLDDAKDTGVSIMRLDREMDHGPLVAVEKTHFNEWQTYERVEEGLGKTGAALLAKILPDWVAGTIAEKEQDHAQATYTKKFSKDDAMIDLTADPYLNFRKIQAYHRAPVAWFFKEKNGKKIRVKVTSASFKEGKLLIEKVIPEGKKEMAYADFTRA